MRESWGKRVEDVKAIKGSGRFKEKGPQHKEHLEVMFEDLHSTGDDHWSASSGVAPLQQSLSDDSWSDDVDEEEYANNEEESVHRWFQKQIELLMEMNERMVASLESIARREDKTGCSIKDIMKLVEDCGAAPGTDEHFIATIVFTKRAEREMFVTMDTAEHRFEWLKRRYEWMTGNDVAK